MALASLCKHSVIAVAALLLAVAPPAVSAHGGGHGGGHGTHAGAMAGAHASAPGARFVGAGPRFNGGGFHASGFHHGHWIHGVRGGQLGWFWVGAAAPLYVEPLVPAAVLVPPESLYYCSALQAYYPEVQNCPEPWLLVSPSPYPE